MIDVGGMAWWRDLCNGLGRIVQFYWGVSAMKRFNRVREVLLYNLAVTSSSLVLVWLPETKTKHTIGSIDLHL